MLDRGLHRNYGRAAEAEGVAATEDPFAADARVDLTELPTFTIDPDDAKDFDDAVSATRENGRVRLWVHIADVTAYLRPGGPLEREATRRATSVYVPGAVEPMLPEVLSNRACSLRPGEEKLAVTVELEMEGAEVRKVAFHRSRVRSDARLTYGQVDAVFAGRERAGEPWAAPLEAAREVAHALHARRDSLAIGGPEPVVRVRRRGPRDRRAPGGADRVAQPDRGADGAGQRAGGRVPRGPQAADAVPGARAPRASLGRVPGRPTGQPRHPHAAAAEEHDPAAGRRRGHRDVEDRGSRGARPPRHRRTGAACAQAGLLHAAQPRPRRPRERALHPLHVADPALSRRGGAPRAASGPRHRSHRPPGVRARRARGAHLGARARGDEDRAQGRRRVPGLPARAPPGGGRSRRGARVRGRGRGADREGRLRALRRRRASRGSWACAACASGGRSTSSARRW